MAASSIPSLQGKTILITGASRGIGRAIGLRAASDGARIVILGKTDQPHPKLPGTIHDAAEEFRSAGGQALACVTDIRHEEQIVDAVEQAVATFGGIDCVVNNASAIFLAGTEQCPAKRFDLMHQVNTRGTYLVTQACLPHLRKSDHAHILNISPPLNLEPRWFAPHLAYSIAKFGMSLCVLGMAEELRTAAIGVNALWPKTAIATAAIQNILGGDDALRRCRKPSIMADAAHWILRRDPTEQTGEFLIDEDVLCRAGQSDLSEYAVEPGQDLLPDFFV